MLPGRPQGSSSPEEGGAGPSVSGSNTDHAKNDSAMGGMTKSEARAIIKRLTGKAVKRR